MYSENQIGKEWIHFYNNGSTWRDSEGNTGNLNGSNDSLECMYTDKKTNITFPLYMGLVHDGVYSFHKNGNVDNSGKPLFRDFYLENSPFSQKDSSFYGLITLNYLLTLNKESEYTISNVVTTILHSIEICFKVKGFSPLPFSFSESNEYLEHQNSISIDNDFASIVIKVRDCVETQSIGQNIVKAKDKTIFAVKDEEGNITLTPEDYYKSNSIRFEFEDLFNPSITFYNNETIYEKISSAINLNPDSLFHFYVYDEYLLTPELISRPYQPFAPFQVTGENVGYLAKDINFLKYGIIMSLSQIE